jgi:hypothetical protein
MAGRAGAMSYQKALSQRAIAISISESPDMEVLGLAEEHLRDAMAEVARHLLAVGARLIYGGDLRSNGFTELLFELVTRHPRAAAPGDARAAVTNYFAWPVHIGMDQHTVTNVIDQLKGAAEVVFLAEDGQVLSQEERFKLSPQVATEDQWANSLTAMRRVLTEVSDARIVLGGRVDGYKGRMPGVAEEALSALQAGHPLYVLGGFGGCAHDIAEELGVATKRATSRPTWPARSAFTGYNADGLRNGLDANENALLARTVHVDQAVSLILRGLFRLEAGGGENGNQP